MTTEIAARFLIISGAILIALGLLMMLLSRMGFGGLPGDINIQRNGMSIFFPIVSCLLLSILLTVVLNLVARR